MRNEYYLYIGGIVMGCIIIGGVLFQMRDIIPWNNMTFYLGAFLSLAIPFGLWFAGDRYYKWSEDTPAEKERRRKLDLASKEVAEKYSKLPFLKDFK